MQEENTSLTVTLPRGEAYFEERQLVETFARHTIEAFGSHCVTVLCLPWSQKQAPPSCLLCPGANGRLDMNHLWLATRGKSICVVACTFTYTEEEAAASRIVDQLHQLGGMCILCAYVVSNALYGNRLHKEQVGNIHRRILNMGVHDVFLTPDMEHQALRSKIRIAYHSWARRFPLLSQVKALEDKNQDLLWNAIPATVIPNFPALNPRLAELTTGVGKYKFMNKLNSRHGTVWECASERHPMVVIKVVQKRECLLPFEVEAVFREFAILKCVVKHPHIVGALDFLHGTMNLYIILEHGGNVNLLSHLKSLPGSRMYATDGLHSFRQIASAVAHCHKKMIAHRDITAHHVVLSTERDGSLFPQLCDFRNAIRVETASTSRFCCGQLPYISPEMLAGRPYAPLAADCWSMGVLLLEIAGGVDSLLNATDVTDEELDILDGEGHSNAEAIAHKIQAYFSVPGQHEKALGFMGGVRDKMVVKLLAGLLETVDARIPLDTCALFLEGTV